MKIFSPKRFLILCIPLQGNTPLASKSICILSILSEPIGIFLTGSFESSFNRSILALPYLKFEIFAHAQLQLFHTAYYLQVSWHDMNLNLHWGYFLINEIGQ